MPFSVKCIEFTASLLLFCLAAFQPAYFVIALDQWFSNCALWISGDWQCTRWQSTESSWASRYWLPSESPSSGLSEQKQWSGGGSPCPRGPQVSAELLFTQWKCLRTLALSIWVAYVETVLLLLNHACCPSISVQIAAPLRKNLAQVCAFMASASSENCKFLFIIYNWTTALLLRMTIFKR